MRESEVHLIGASSGEAVRRHRESLRKELTERKMAWSETERDDGIEEMDGAGMKTEIKMKHDKQQK